MFITKMEIFSKTIGHIDVTMIDGSEICIKGIWNSDEEYYVMDFYCTVPVGADGNNVTIEWIACETDDYGCYRECNKSDEIYMRNMYYESHRKFELTNSGLVERNVF